MEQFHGKKVVVVGNGKSGLDILKNLVEHGKCANLIHNFREPRWPYPFIYKHIEYMVYNQLARTYIHPT
jgi:cation diffusion facilitator CzcD-associated flavoprotein CzcO